MAVDVKQKKVIREGYHDKCKLGWISIYTEQRDKAFYAETNGCQKCPICGEPIEMKIKITGRR